MSHAIHDDSSGHLQKLGTRKRAHAFLCRKGGSEIPPTAVDWHAHTAHIHTTVPSVLHLGRPPCYTPTVCRSSSSLPSLRWSYFESGGSFFYSLSYCSVPSIRPWREEVSPKLCTNKPAYFCVLKQGKCHLLSSLLAWPRTPASRASKLAALLLIPNS